MGSSLTLASRELAMQARSSCGQSVHLAVKRSHDHHHDEIRARTTRVVEKARIRSVGELREVEVFPPPLPHATLTTQLSRPRGLSSPLFRRSGCACARP